MRAPSRCIWLSLLCACGPSIEGHVEDLSDPQLREAARQELLLAKERAIGPLLEALESQDQAAARGQLVEVITGLMTRVDDARLTSTLSDLLQSDPDADIRRQIAHFAAVHRRIELADALLDALQDSDGAVRYEALVAVTSMKNRLTPEQTQRFASKAPDFLTDSHPAVRLEGMIAAEGEAGKLIADAERAVLEARLVAAESLYALAVARYPFSRRALYRQARYFYDGGNTAIGLQKLRDAGMLLDVPRLPRPPVLDGRVDNDIWDAAARADSFYQFSFSHPAALPTQNPTTMWVGYTDRSLFIAFRGHDDHPDSLIANFSADMAASADTYDGGQLQGTTIWKDDIIELFLDADFDHTDYAHMGINSQGVRVDEWIKAPQQQIFQSGGSPSDWNDASWRAQDAVAVYVGDDFWSIEYQLDFASPEFPTPAAGTIWGFNLVRVFRGEEYSQWARTYAGGHSPDDFGVLLFQ